MGIDFAKKQYKPTLTDAACEEIANKYGELREEERNQTLPITARCLETIIRLSTAHAKLRLSKKITIDDVNAAMEILQFALTNDAEPEQKKKPSRRHEESDEDEDEEMGDSDNHNVNVQESDDEEMTSPQRRKKRKQKKKKKKKKKKK